MSLIIDETKKVFNLSEISRGTLISGKYCAWDKTQDGIVTDVMQDRIRVMTFPETQNVQNHYIIRVEDVEDGLWTLRYSSDGLQTVTVYEGGEVDES